MIAASFDPLARLQQWLFEAWVQPLLFSAGWMRYEEQAYDALEWLPVGVLEVLLVALVLGTLQRRWPVEPVADRAAVRTDIAYTLLHRLGLFPLLAFVVLAPAFDALEARLRWLGVSRLSVEQWLPDALDSPVLVFVVYLVALDAIDYLVHRGQHRWRWWWALHAVHHSQRQMTMWSDNRNHLLDDVLRDSVFVIVALLVGIAPAQFVAVVALTQLVETFSHANVRLSFGRIGERLLVSPRFHRVHHGIGIGHESGAPGSLGGHNFAVLFPLWDALFGTARWHDAPGPTGIRDQLPEYGGRDYGQGFWAQQWLGLVRLVRLARPAGLAKARQR